MTAESHEIAELLASAIYEPGGFPPVALGPMDAHGQTLRTGIARAERDVIWIVVTDRCGGRREYIAAVLLVAEELPQAAAHVNQFCE